VDFELLLDLKIEQKKGTSLVKPLLSRRKSGLQTERLSVPVIYFRYRAGIHPEIAIPYYNHLPVDHASIDVLQ
jgi:hypothetical protein